MCIQFKCGVFDVRQHLHLHIKEGRKLPGSPCRGACHPPATLKDPALAADNMFTVHLTGRNILVAIIRFLLNFHFIAQYNTIVFEFK